MHSLTVTFTDRTVDELDALANDEYGGDREEAVRDLLDMWLTKYSTDLDEF